jgi:hypothetical protein
VTGLGPPGAYCFISGPIALYLQPVFVDAPAAPALISSYLILKRALNHSTSFHISNRKICDRRKTGHMTKTLRGEKAGFFTIRKEFRRIEDPTIRERTGILALQ